MKIVYLCIGFLVITTVVAKQDDWKDIFALFPFFENDIYTRNHHPVAAEAQFVDNLLKRQENNVINSMGQMSPKRCNNCCCKPDYTHRDIFVEQDKFLTVMEVNKCHSICPGYQMCKKEASSLTWSKFNTTGIFSNTTMVYTSCSCV